MTEMTSVSRPQGAPVGYHDDIDALAISTIRFLAADAVQAANSGHPGLPLGAAPMAWWLWSRYLRHDPSAPNWPDRDRFVLSAGHGSMLLYALLHLFGYGVELDDLRQFRQLGSLTPGHPEYGHTPGVETTTGPLGQGLANAVGMALAERMLAARCADAEHPVVDHRTWVLAGDGDLMEGISHEAASLAGRLGLGRLVVLYDDNDITIDGPATSSCADDALARFAAYGWRVHRVEDGNDLSELDSAMRMALEDDGRPTLIAVRTTIGYGAPTLAGTSKAHGSPLGEAEIAAMRARFDWPEEAFVVPDAVRERCADVARAGSAERERWEETWSAWSAAHPDLAAAFDLSGIPVPPADLVAALPTFTPGSRMATRKASQTVLNAVAGVYPALVGGSADLAGSTGTALAGDVAVTNQDYSGRTINFGIREHGMAAALNGISLHGGLRPFGSTFLVFADYLRPSLRLSALMKQPVVYVFTHDSVHVGEDGPTHQPIEQLESIRLIPGVTVLRPADASETAACWRIACENTTGPTVLVLTRQDLTVLPDSDAAAVITDGWQIAEDSDGAEPDVVLAASGSEVDLARAARAALVDEGIRATVLSVPWRERAERSLWTGGSLSATTPVIWIEAGVTTGWRALARPSDVVIGLDRFGESGDGAAVAEHLGLNVATVVAAARGIVGGRREEG